MRRLLKLWLLYAQCVATSRDCILFLRRHVALLQLEYPNDVTYLVTTYGTIVGTYQACTKYTRLD